MITSAIGTNKSLYVTDTKQKSYDSSSIQSNALDVKNEMTDLVKVSEDSNTLVQLSGANSDSNTAAKNLRDLYDAVSQMDELVDQAIKNYPPFPVGSEDRAEFLKSFSSLRNLINKLTIPPDRSTENPGEYAISNLDEQSTYDELLAVKEKINDIKKGLGAEYADINSEVTNSLIFSEPGVVDYAQTVQADTKSGTTGDLSEKAAEQKSAEIKDSLGMSLFNSLIEAKEKIAALLE